MIWFGGRIRAVIHPMKGTVLAEQETAQTDTKELTERELQEEFDAELMIIGKAILGPIPRLVLLIYSVNNIDALSDL
jgi:hypothetical protein